MSGDERTKVERLAMKHQLAKELVRVVFVREIDLADVADAAGVSESLPSRWGSKKCPDAIGLVDVVLVGRRFPGFGHDLLRWAGEQLGLVVSKRLTAAAVGDHLAHVATVARESGEALAAYAGGIADGQLDDTELATLDRELRGLEEAAASLRTWVDEERERRSVPRLSARRGEAA